MHLMDRIAFAEDGLGSLELGYLAGLCKPRGSFFCRLLHSHLGLLTGGELLPTVHVYKFRSVRLDLFGSLTLNLKPGTLYPKP